MADNEPQLIAGRQPAGKKHFFPQTLIPISFKVVEKNQIRKTTTTSNRLFGIR